jgi:hypothetical protein
VTSHPLDVDLADLVDGVLGAARAEQVEAHLEDCLLCQLKHRRLEGAPAPAAGAGPPLAAPAFLVPPAAEAGGEPAAGDLWLAGDDERLLVLIRSVAGDRATVAPVTFDTEAADDEAVVVDESPFRTAVAVYPALATEVPRGALRTRLGTLSRGGAPRPPAAGPTDPRLEARQHLATALAAFAGPPPAATGAGAPLPRPEQVRSSLIADLRAMRGRACRAESLGTWDGLVLAEARGWRPLATIDEVGVVLVVLDTPHGLEDELDFDAARSVLTRSNASALVVTTTALSELADVYDAAALHAGIDLPAGAHGPPRPLISGLAPFDAVAKFLDQHAGARAMAAPTRSPVARVEVADVLRAEAAAAASEAARQGARFKIAPKRRGYESLDGAEADLAGALATAFEGGSVVAALQALASQPPEGGGG